MKALFLYNFLTGDIQSIYIHIVPLIKQKNSVKLANSTSPFKFCQVKFPQKKHQKTGIEIDKNVFSTKRNWIQLDTVYEKHILSFSKPASRGILTWWNLKGLAELANLTVTLYIM